MFCLACMVFLKPTKNMDLQLLLINSKAWAHLLPARRALFPVLCLVLTHWAGHCSKCFRYREKTLVSSWKQKLGLLHTSEPLVPYQHTTERALTISGGPMGSLVMLLSGEGDTWTPSSLDRNRAPIQAPTSPTAGKNGRRWGPTELRDWG